MDVTDADFEKKVTEQSKDKVIVVDFWASWCVPCNMLGPMLEKVVKSYGDKVLLVKANVDECSGLANKYGINAIPAVKIFKDGEIAGQFTGVVPEDTIKKQIDEVIAK